MFSLSARDLKKTILGCGDGPASFNAELTAAGGNVISVDPIYEFTATQIRTRIDDAYNAVMSQVEQAYDKYTWTHIRNVGELREVRMNAMLLFLSDYERGRNTGRYRCSSLPQLPFDDNKFELALCSHFLFLYSAQVNLDLHIRGMQELCRVAREVRVYPLIALDGKVSPHLQAVREALTDSGVHLSTEPVEYEFMKGAVEMLVANKCRRSNDGTVLREHEG